MGKAVTVNVEKIKWTPAQKLAIERRGNTLVCAAAGSGKTAALTAKIMHILSEPDSDITLRDMLIVTYTKPAARELRERIGAKLAEAASRDRRMMRHLGDLPSADICTIHSFCLKILRENFTQIGLTPDFTVADEADAQVMKDRAMEDTIDDFFGGIYKMPDSDCADIIELCDTIGGTRDSSSFDYEMKRIYDTLRSLGFDAGRLTKYADMLESAAKEDFLSTVWGEVVRNEIKAAAEHWYSVITSLISEMAENEEVVKQYIPAAQSLSDYLQRIWREAERGTYLSLKEAVEKYSPEKLGRLSAKHKTEASENFKAMKDEVKKLFTKYANKFFALTPEEIADSEKRTARVLRGAARVLEVYGERFSLLKREKNVLDYQDLESLAMKLFSDEDGNPSETAVKAGKRYKYIFIDEYQDTNRIQDSIFRMISTCSDRFIVGDIKQSIYRFRGAEPDVFSEYRSMWPAVEPDEDGGFSQTDGLEERTDGTDSRSIFMSENFRCSEKVIKFANAVSEHMFSHGSIPFSKRDLLIFSSGSSVDENVEVCLIEPDPEQKQLNPEALYTARRIADMIGKDVCGTGIVKPSDIAVLLRSANKSAADYIDALAELGIPARSVAGVSFADESEVMLVLDILRAVDNPLRDIELAGAMHSSIFGFSLDELVKIRMNTSDGPLYYSVLEAAGMICGAEDSVSAENAEEITNLRRDAEYDRLCEKCADFCRRLDSYRAAERSMSADTFIDYLYAETGMLNAPEITKKAGGAKNLHTLLDMARQYESGVFGGLYGFLQYIQEKIDSGSLTSEISGNDAVNIISIHKSKGLEFPICFLCETGKERNTSDEDANLLIDRELGAAMRLPDPGGLIRCGTPIRGAVSEKLRLAGVMEEMRVLYVAMTRARDKLIVTAKVRDAVKKLDTIRRNAPYTSGYTVNSASKMIDYILTAQALSDEKICDIITPKEIEETKSVTAQKDLTDTSQALRMAEDEVKSAAAQFAFEYEYKFLSSLPSKLTVSKLYPEILDPEDKGTELLPDGLTESEPDMRDTELKMPIPKFMSGSTDFTPAQRGTSTHVFMQFADFENLYTNGAKPELERLLEKKFITADMASLVNLAQIERFRESGIFERIRNARTVKREFRFNVKLPAEKFTSDPELSEKFREYGASVTVQGVFDCVFLDNAGSLVLIDYKTDAVNSYELSHPEAAFEKLRRRHYLQMKYYTEACALLFGRAPDEAYIYSLPLGRTVDMRFNEEPDK